MAFQVPFGQYLPGESFVHALDGRTKLLVAVAATFALFASTSWWALAALTVFTATGYCVARVPLRIALRGLKPLLFILVFTVLANGFTFQADSFTGALPLIGSFGIRPDGLLLGLFFALRISLLVLLTSLITFTTSAIALADALTSLMAPLRVLHVPVDDVATMFSIALRFIPTTAEEAEKIVVAQTARGVRFDQGSILTRARAWVPVLVPLFVGLFRRADDLAAAMEARCYTGEGRTRLSAPLMRASDWLFLALACAACITLGVVL